MLKLHLNVGTSWNFYLLLISDSIITKRKFKLVTYRRKKIHLQDWMEAWRIKCLIYLNEQMNLLERSLYLFSIHRKSHLCQPRVPTHYLPNLLAGTLWDCPTLWSSAISWGQMPSLFSFIPPGIKSFKWDSLFLHFEFEEHGIIFPKSWSALHNPPK